MGILSYGTDPDGSRNFPRRARRQFNAAYAESLTRASGLTIATSGSALGFLPLGELFGAAELESSQRIRPRRSRKPTGELHAEASSRATCSSQLRARRKGADARCLLTC